MLIVVIRTDKESPCASGISSGSDDEAVTAVSSADAETPPSLLVGSGVAVNGINPSAARLLRAESIAGIDELSEDADDDTADDTLLRGVDEIDGAACAELALLLLRERRGLEEPVVIEDSLSSRTILKDNSRCVSKYAICREKYHATGECCGDKSKEQKTKNTTQQEMHARWCSFSVLLTHVQRTSSRASMNPDKLTRNVDIC